MAENNKYIVAQNKSLFFFVYPSQVSALLVLNLKRDFTSHPVNIDVSREKGHNSVISCAATLYFNLLFFFIFFL